jgi:hypothetical protein
MAILHLSIRLSERCSFAIFRPTIFKFGILIEDYVRINEMIGYFDSLSISSDIELGLRPSQIIILHHFLRIFSIPFKFRNDPMTNFGSLNH